MAMILREILHSKGHTVHTISSNSTLEEVVQALVRHNCGSLVVFDGDSASGRMAGIITERDILRACAKHHAPLSELKVADTMTLDIVVGSPCDSVEDTMGFMTQMRIRHLPIVEDGRLLGLVSIGDLVKELLAVREATLALVRSLDEAGLTRQTVANNRPVSGRAIVWIIAGHTQHHLGVLHERYGITDALGALAVKAWEPGILGD